MTHPPVLSPPELDRSSAAPSHRRPGLATRVLGVLLAAGMLVAIAIVTLTPLGPSASTGQWCVVCGTIGGADVLANVALFLPLGVAFVLAGMSWRRAILVGAAISTSIEITQFLAVAGRYATLSDILTNTTGTALGAALAHTRHAWLRPRASLAAALAALASAAWLAALGAGAWAYGGSADPVPRPAAPSPYGHPPGFGWFAGAVDRASVNGVEVGHRGGGPVILEAGLGNHVDAWVSAVGVDNRGGQVPLLFVHAAGDSTPRLLLSQYADDAVFSVERRGGRADLRQPKVKVRGAFARIPLGTPYRLEGRLDGDSLTLSVSAAGLMERHSVRLEPTLGWALLSPVPAIDAPIAPLASMAWIGGLALPIGYWARWAARRRSARAAGGAALLVLGVLAVGLIGVPRLGGFPGARAREWVAAVAGVTAGAAAAVALDARRRRS